MPRLDRSASLLALLPLLASPAAAADLTRTCSAAGDQVVYALTGTPQRVFAFLPSTSAGPTPLALFDPADPRVLSVGTDLLKLLVVGAFPLDGHATLKYTLPNAAALQGIELHAQFVELAFAPTLFGDLSNATVFTLSKPGATICVDSFPFVHDSNTAVFGSSKFNAYACKPSVNESGPEVVYEIHVPKAGFLSAAVYDGVGVDVDVHILASLDPNDCLARGHHDAGADVPAGTFYVVVDSWVGSNGTVYKGAYTVEIGLYAPSFGPCAMDKGIMKRVGDGGDHLVMPATGPIVKEAHLVTQAEPPPYPASPTDELAAHHKLSQALTGFVMNRQETWAPLEGGSFYGAGIGSPTVFPVLHEGWYVNMYWTPESRPPKGTRMILRLPGTSRAVVVAAGYETGPGDLAKIGGTPEETHFYLGTEHKDVMTLGIATDQTLPFGPRFCAD